MNPMIEVFYTGIITLIVCSLIFYAVLFSFIFYWHKRLASVVIVPSVFALEFFLRGFFVVSAVTIILHYLPTLF